ncbi:MAG: hypothetical protein AB7P78_06120 [Candidatus Binatia bacterium]
MILASAAVAAGPDAATTCATGLEANARAIYDASVGEVTPATDLKALLTANTKALVEAGAVPRSSARESARAAAQCLKLKQQTD